MGIQVTQQKQSQNLILVTVEANWRMNDLDCARGQVYAMLEKIAGPAQVILDVSEAGSPRGLSASALNVDGEPFVVHPKAERVTIIHNGGMMAVHPALYQAVGETTRAFAYTLEEASSY